MKSHFTVPGFFRQANVLRKHFEQRFGDVRSTAGDRFVWDFWHVPGQYRHLRTPAAHFFPAPMYQALHQQLVQWGRQHLGCHDISPPWLSCYVDGCYQDLHGDLPHGPWAYVFSLTPWASRKFRGGETLLVKDQVLDFWADHSIYQKGLEHRQVFHAIAPKFNQLTVFDPRIPHGVKRVEGAEGVTDGRLVIHGWFVQPQPFIAGPLPHGQLKSFVYAMTEELGSFLDANLSDNGEWARGVFTVRFTVDASGLVQKFHTLPSTLRSSVANAERNIVKLVRDFTTQYRFKANKNSSVVTLPVRLE